MPKVTLRRVTGYRRSHWERDNAHQPRILRARHAYSFDFSNEDSALPLRTFPILPDSDDFHQVSRAAGPKRHA
jgi:hypothetical protein